MWRLKLCCHKPRSHWKLRETPGADPCLPPSEGEGVISPENQHIVSDFQSTQLTAYKFLLIHSVCGTLLSSQSKKTNGVRLNLAALWGIVWTCAKLDMGR